MINLFNIPNYTIDTSKFTNLLHDKIVSEFEQNFANYVGAKYAVSFNSATSAIFLLFNLLKKYDSEINIEIPSIIPPAVPHALINAGRKVFFNDEVDWVGSNYTLYKTSVNGVLINIIDSAQKVEKDQYRTDAVYKDDLIIFSFYPTKPVGSCDGGIIVSNNNFLIKQLRTLTFNGMLQTTNSWERKIIEVGHKMYMNSVQAYIANENLKRLNDKQNKINLIRKLYNKAFNLTNTSKHLYRLEIKDRTEFINKAKQAGISCGIHYLGAHKNPLYSSASTMYLHKTENVANNFVSIPFHEKLKNSEITKIIEFINEHRRI